MKELEELQHTNLLTSPAAILDGVLTSELRQLDTLSVETVHHTYEITILNPAFSEVLVRGGEHFPERTPARVHGIYVGAKMELQTEKGRILTSRVRSIALV